MLSSQFQIHRLYKTDYWYAPLFRKSTISQPKEIVKYDRSLSEFTMPSPHSQRPQFVVFWFFLVFCFCGLFGLFAWGFCFGLFVVLFLVSLCFLHAFARLSSFTDWCIAHRQQSREQKKHSQRPQRQYWYQKAINSLISSLWSYSKRSDRPEAW